MVLFDFPGTMTGAFFAQPFQHFLLKWRNLRPKLFFPV